MGGQQPPSAREVALASPSGTEPSGTKQPRKPKTGKDESLPTELRELFDLILTYARQQTIDPLKKLGRWVAFGVAGALLVGLGFLLIGLGLLRAIQSEAGRHLAGDWSWVPYFVVVLFLGAVIGLMVRRMSHGPASEER
jgi:hypothetical protein